ncbi:dynein regulatory complex subunit 5 isoform X4 [Choloepus didactylus]|uniref:dynein regulatory complex subunit 5 isoform X4 n=1 Tax=Choloepus didactylus TaxID=27675 RepID=UPI00189E98CD|nr:dynein regulatory complex subunit 5 isoform X4 [Choloepus didactylus]
MQETVTPTSLSVPSRSSASIQERSSTAGQGTSSAPPSLKPSVMAPPVKSKGPGKRQMRRIIAEDAEWSLAIVPLLTELCIQHIVKNFQNNPILNQLLPQHKQKVLSCLSPDLPLTVTANLIEDENYWRRCCTRRWPVHHVAKHGGSWKRMFFERHLENLLKHFIPGTTDPAVILDLLPLCRNYVRSIQLDQFLPPVRLPPPPRNAEPSDSGSEGEAEELTMDHYQLGDLVAGLSHLEELDLVYGVKDCGMNFEWNLFLFTFRDCHSLAATIKACQTLKVLSINTTLTSINLSCNHIGLDGGKQLLEGMSENRTLLEFDLRLSDVAQESEYLMGKKSTTERPQCDAPNRQRDLSPSQPTPQAFDPGTHGAFQIPPSHESLSPCGCQHNCPPWSTPTGHTRRT